MCVNNNSIFSRLIQNCGNRKKKQKNKERSYSVNIWDSEGGEGSKRNKYYLTDSENSQPFN